MNLAPESSSGSLPSSTLLLNLIHLPRPTVGLSIDIFVSNEAPPSLCPAINKLPPLFEAGLSHSMSSSQGNLVASSGSEERKTPTEMMIAKEVKPAKYSKIKAPLVNKVPLAVDFKFDPQV
ncbi:hypothetical protein DSO57_1010819 [Entomophthora muscae]|uniref:Uncharacterized protein n=1 Tax=Entomophthora muscae TaxID=34485 RepID=A0ACC2S8G6_9FUNG|nr:hypothetical protein DSO57_1010819 [Entomophthora muscae]